MKTLIDVDLSILEDYQEFADANPNNWNIQAYVNVKYDINAAISFGKFYFPNFIERKKCIIIESQFDEYIFENWFNNLNGNVKEIEKMCNLYTIKDYFHINSIDYSDSQIDALGKVLEKSLYLNLKYLYPNLIFIIEVFDYYGEKSITFFQET